MGTFVRNPKLNLSPKLKLIQLNHSLDRISADILDCDVDEQSHSLIDREMSNFIKAVLFLEDRQFFKHAGFDFRSIPRGIKRFFLGRRLGGISTLDQQVVRISRNKYDRTISRKAVEIILSVALNTRVSKRHILQYYINHSYFGYRLRGCDQAAKYIFRKSAKQLNASQSCFIAALLPLPLPRVVYTAIKNKNIQNPEDVFSIAWQTCSP